VKPFDFIYLIKHTNEKDDRPYCYTTYNKAVITLIQEYAVKMKIQKEKPPSEDILDNMYSGVYGIIPGFGEVIVLRVEDEEEEKNGGE